tara:strand:+ start:163 stop:729 length:567 start_codon:yes stop_codon:yes gene_type:complete
MSDFGKSGKERVREYKAMESILRGETPEKRIFVGYEGKKQKQGDIESPLTEIMKDVRMPMFCKSCDRIMNKKVDDSAWAQFGHCFDCQIEFENKLIIKGTYDDWRKKRAIQNKIAELTDKLDGIEEFRSQSVVKHYNAINPELGALDEEKYEVADKEEWNEKIDEALDFYKNAISKLNTQLEEYNEVD